MFLLSGSSALRHTGSLKKTINLRRSSRFGDVVVKVSERCPCCCQAEPFSIQPSGACRVVCCLKREACLKRRQATLDRIVKTLLLDNSSDIFILTPSSVSWSARQLPSRETDDRLRCSPSVFAVIKSPGIVIWVCCSHIVGVGTFWQCRLHAGHF